MAAALDVVSPGLAMQSWKVQLDTHSMGTTVTGFRAPHPLAGITAKLERSDESTRNLSSEINSFIQNNVPIYKLIREFQNDGRDYVIKVRGAPDLPLRFAVVAGEVIHHLRSTLDHLVVALAARNGQDPLNQHQFPECRKQDKFEKAVRGGCTKGISASALKLIADAQPYLRPRPDDYFLTALHELDVVDKHRLLLVVAAAARMGQRVDIGVDEAKAAELGITPVDVAIIGLGIPIRCKISESPTEIFRIMLAEPDPVFHADVDIICDVAFEKCGSIEMPSIIVALESLRKATARLVDKFANEF